MLSSEHNVPLESNIRWEMVSGTTDAVYCWLGGIEIVINESCLSLIGNIWVVFLFVKLRKFIEQPFQAVALWFVITWSGLELKNVESFIWQPRFSLHSPVSNYLSGWGMKDETKAGLTWRISSCGQQQQDHSLDIICLVTTVCRIRRDTPHWQVRWGLQDWMTQTIINHKERNLQEKPYFPK